MAKIRPITPDLEENIWNKWKDTVPRSTTLSQAIEDLIMNDLTDKNTRQRKKTQQKK